MEEKVTIKDLISSYNELETSDKRKELGREITEMTIVLKKILGDMSSMNLPNVSLEELYLKIQENPNIELDENIKKLSIYEEVPEQ